MNRTIFLVFMFSKALLPYTITNTAEIYYHGTKTTTNAVYINHWKYGVISGKIMDTLNNQELLGVSVYLGTYTLTFSTYTYSISTPIWQDNENWEFKATKTGYYEKERMVSLSSSTTSLNFSLCPTKREIPNYTWRMVSFPVEPDGSAQILGNTLITGDDLGRQDQDKWRVYIWDEDASEDEYLSKYISPGTITSGLGYWFKYYNPGTISLFTRGTPTSGTLTIPLKRGWNMIGNPGVFRINKGNLKCQLGTYTYPLGSYTEGVFWGYDNVYKDENSLLPHYGYWIRAVSPCNLIFPAMEWDDYYESPGIFSLDNSFVRIFASQGIFEDSKVFGIKDNASDGYDFGLDLSFPPSALDSSLSLCFINQGERLARDIRKPGDDITFDVSIKGENKQIKLFFDGIENIDKEYQVFLVDSSNIFDLRKNPTYTLDSPRDIKIRLIKEGLIIQENKITKAITYPNPSRGELTFYIAIKTKGASLRVTIYNIIGQKVYEGPLMPAIGKSWERYSKEEGAYIYESTYSGRGSHNLPLANGLYFYEITSSALNSEAKALGKLLIKR